MPYKKKEFCAIIGMNNNIYVIGGSDDKEYYNHFYLFSKVSKSVEMYNMEKDIWIKLEDMNQQRKGFCAICMPDGLYVFGGSDGCQTLKSVEK